MPQLSPAKNGRFIHLQHGRLLYSLQFNQKCDCVRPVCGQCVRFNRERDCEYTDGDQRSRTEILEEQIATLQARIGTLENPVDPVATIQVSQFRNGSRRSPFEDPAEFGIGMLFIHTCQP